MRVLFLMLGLLSGIAAVVPAGAVEREKPLAVDERAPDFTLDDQHGKPFRLTETLSQRDFVILAFYPKAFSGG